MVLLPGSDSNLLETVRATPITSQFRESQQVET